jgi:hypothetical protein
MEIIGDKPIDDISRSDANRVLNQIKLLPANTAKYRNNTVPNFRVTGNDWGRKTGKKRAKLSRVLEKRALKSFHSRLFNVRFLTGESWSVSNGRYVMVN